MEDYNEYEQFDHYDAMPFGDAIRFEENLLASEHEDFDEDDEPDFVYPDPDED